MSCYFRHLGDILRAAGIEVTPANRRQIDLAIHEIVGVSYKECPAAWKKLKQDILTDSRKQQDFAERLREAVRG